MSKSLIVAKLITGAASAYGKYDIGKKIGNALDRRTTGEKISAGLKKYWRNKKKALKGKFK
jgi:hypothetical protein